MKKNPFKVDDRVRVYEGNASRDVSIRKIEGDYIWPSRFHEGAHWKQCRRLVKKPRKTIWVNEYSADRDSEIRLQYYAFSTEQDAKEWVSDRALSIAVPYREVREKKK